MTLKKILSAATLTSFLFITSVPFAEAALSTGKKIATAKDNAAFSPDPRNPPVRAELIFVTTYSDGSTQRTTIDRSCDPVPGGTDYWCELDIDD